MSDRGINRERWAELTIFEQMGNIGSEVGRAISADRAGRDQWRDGAIDRAIDLFNATAEVWIKQEQPWRAREVLRAKEAFLSLFFGPTDIVVDADELERYFMQFALAARAGR
jgi:hypothetical protein